MMSVRNETLGETTTLFVSGEIDLKVSPELSSLIDTAMDAITTLKLNLKEVSYIDSTGIAVLVQTLKAAKRNTINLIISEPSERVLAVIELAQLHRIFSIETA